MSTLIINKPRELTIEQLLLLCKDGDSRAQKTLYERYADRMFRVAYRYVKNEFDAEDILINGFVKVFQNLCRMEYMGEKSLEAWIKRIVINEALMHLRKNNNFNLVEDTYANTVGEASTIHSELAAEEIYALILQLPIGYRTVFNLYVIEGYSHKEIAEKLNVSENTSKSQLSKGRALLRKILEKNGIHYEI
ncbi:sigma-70 family RNA polymerase sigma factor [Fulvivirgaceae bacterium BMA10]|uniref:Sigma-70 family RNA polymerase sigma factor n=1 Tax=Splendidivirga corallicola TaxID=3051826 RepID=A0ABT8KWL1_9BACT|nr:sigma-70 family RNA polymerase sigma factor [Fulvivirgaceae bacterium BMA10]